MNQYELAILEQSENPFEAGRINLLSPWENPLNSDVFNLSVRRKLLDEIIRFSNKDQATYSEFRVLVGDKGEGKTHILCTLRDKLIESEKCLFIYIRPATLESYNYDGTDVKSHIYYHILNQIEDSIFRQINGKQGNIIITTILNHFVIPFLKENEKYKINIPKTSPDTLDNFNKKLRKELNQKGITLDALFERVRTSYIAQSRNVDYETVYYLFKYAIYNFDKNNLVNLAKWLKGVQVGERKVIARTDKALSVIKTINDIIVRSGKHLVIVFDQFERTITEQQIIDNLKDERIEDELYRKLDTFFTNIWRLMEEVRKTFFIFSLREENWKAFKVYLRTIRSHLESRFSDIYVIYLEKFTEDKALQILKLFLRNLVYNPLNIREDELITEYFPYFKNGDEKNRKRHEYIRRTPLDHIQNLEIFTDTISDKHYLSESDDGQRHIIRNFLEECSKSYNQLLDSYRYKQPVGQQEKYFPDCKNFDKKRYIDHDFVETFNKERGYRDIIEKIRIYLTTLITESTFVKQVSVLLVNQNTFEEIDYENKKLQKLIYIKDIDESFFLEEDNELNFLLSIEFPRNTTRNQLENCKNFLDKDNWFLQNKKKVTLYERSSHEDVKKINFNLSGNFNIKNIEHLAEKIGRDLKFIFSIKLRNTARGKDVGRICNIDYQERTITILLPHKYTKNNNQAKVILEFDKQSTSEMMDKGKKRLEEWIRKNL
jgi:hypothetical protein